MIMNKTLHEQLRQVIREGLNEGMKRSRRPIYTIQAEYIEAEQEYWDGRYAHNYTDEEDAIQDAQKFASELTGDDDVIVVWVYAGEFMTPSGDIVGEPYSIYSASNKDPEATRRALEKMGFHNTKCEWYATENE